MKKINVILDETTIINFSFFFSLLKRYYITTLIIPFLVFSIAYYKLKNQTTFYSQSILLEITKSKGKSQGFGSLFGKDSETVSAKTIISVASSLDFRQELAENIYNNYNFKELQFSESKEKLLGYCKDEKKCIIHIFRNMLPDIYNFKESGSIKSVMTLSYNSLDPNTGKIIIKEVIKLLNKTRIESTRKKTLETKKITLKLIQEKNEDLMNANMEGLQRNAKLIEEEISDLEIELATVGQHFNAKKLSLQYAKSNYLQTKKVAHNNRSISSNIQYKKMDSIKEKITQLRNDINILEPEKKSTSDNYILKQLKNELKEKQRELKKYKYSTKFSKNQRKFASDKGNDVSEEEFNFKLIKAQLKGLGTKHQNLIDKKVFLTKKLDNITSKLNKYLPIIEYIKILEKKVIQSDLILSTVVSDISFAKNFTDTVDYKHLRPEKIYTFAFVISLFIIFTLTFSRYLMDTRVYSEYELEKNFEDLEIIGRTPEFK